MPRGDRGDSFVSTIPMPDLIRALRPKVPAEALAAANALQFRGMIFLFLCIDKESVSDDHWIYFPDGHLIFNHFRDEELQRRSRPNWQDLLNRGDQLRPGR